MTFTLRNYQRRALDSLYRVWRTKELRNPLIVAPTGSGKGSMIGAFCQEAVQTYPLTRIICATHKQELVEQNYLRLKAMWPDAPAGIFAAGLKRRDSHSPILFTSIQSVFRRGAELGGADVLLIDEAHMVSRDSSSMYGQFIESCRAQRGHMKVAGFTATKYRLDSGWLTDPYQDEEPLFDGIADEITIRELLDAGHLCPLESTGTATTFNVSKVKKRGGEFVASSLAAAVNKNEINKKVVAEAIRLEGPSKHWIVFCVNVEHANNICELLNAGGISAATVTGDMNKTLRRQTIADYKAGKFKALVSVDVLTTGFDHPELDYIVGCRPTASPGLYVQMMGRGMRTAPGKTVCRVSDFAGNAFNHGPIDQIEGIRKDSKPASVFNQRASAMRDCPQCLQAVPAQSTVCPECQFEMPRDPFASLATEAADAPIISNGHGKQVQTVWRSCAGVSYDVIHKGSKEYLRAKYDIGLKTPATEVVAPEKLGEWWKPRSLKGLVPADLRMATYMLDDLRTPSEVLTYRNAAYINAISVR